MIVNGEYVMTEEDVRNQRMRALYAVDESGKNLSRLLAQAKIFGGKLSKIARMLTELEFEPEELVQSESSLLSLPKDEYAEVLSLETIKALANSIALARRELAEAVEVKRRVE